MVWREDGGRSDGRSDGRVSLESLDRRWTPDRSWESSESYNGLLGVNADGEWVTETAEKDPSVNRCNTCMKWKMRMKQRSPSVDVTKPKGPPRNRMPPSCA
jgi:hypothetical protein